MKNLLAALALAIGMVACAAVPDDIDITPASGRSMLILEATPSRGSVAEVPEFSVTIARYDAEQGRLDAGFAGGWARVNSATRGADGRYWLVGQAEPGLYVITDLTHQSLWHNCFNAGTRAFTVGPGQVIFLGRIDPVPALMTMALTLPSMSMNSQHHFAMDQEISFIPAGNVTNWQAPVEAFVREQFPNVTAPLTAIGSEVVTFNTGRDIFGTQRVCGGYYAPASN